MAKAAIWIFIVLFTSLRPSPLPSFSFPGRTCFEFRRWKFMEADECQGDWIQTQSQWACCQILSTLTENTVSRKRWVIIKESDLASNLHKISWMGFWFSFLNKQNNVSWLAVPKVFPLFSHFLAHCWKVMLMYFQNMLFEHSFAENKSPFL